MSLKRWIRVEMLACWFTNWPGRGWKKSLSVEFFLDKFCRTVKESSQHVAALVRLKANITWSKHTWAALCLKWILNTAEKNALLLSAPRLGAQTPGRTFKLEPPHRHKTLRVSCISISAGQGNNGRRRCRTLLHLLPAGWKFSIIKLLCFQGAEFTQIPKCIWDTNKRALFLVSCWQPAMLQKLASRWLLTAVNFVPIAIQFWCPASAKEISTGPRISFER